MVAKVSALDVEGALLDLEGVLEALHLMVWQKCNLPGYHSVTALAQVAIEKAQGIRDVIERPADPA